MSRNDGVEIQLQSSFQRLRPFEETTALGVIDIDIDPGRSCRTCRGPAAGGASKKEVARVNDVEFGKIDDGISARVTASEVFCANLFSAQVQREFIGECNSRQPDRCTGGVLVIGLLNIGKIDANV